LEGTVGSLKAEGKSQQLPSEEMLGASQKMRQIETPGEEFLWRTMRLRLHRRNGANEKKDLIHTETYGNSADHSP